MLTDAKNIKFPQLKAAQKKLYRKIANIKSFEITGGNSLSIISKRFLLSFFLNIKL